MMGYIQIILENNIKIALAILACLLICKITHVKSVRIRMLLMSLVWVRIIIPFSIKFNVNSTSSYVLTKMVNTGDFNSQTIVSEFFLKIWCVGVVLLLFYNIVVDIRFRNILSTSVPQKLLIGNCMVKIYKNDYINSALVYGLIKPKIYISSRVNDVDIEYLYEHESMHIRRKHHIIKIITGVTSLIYWYNPLIWIFYMQYAECIELVCDYDCCDKHINETDWNKNYVNILLNAAQVKQVTQIRILGFASAAVAVRKRVSNIMREQKVTISNKLISIPVFIIIMLMLFLKSEIQNIEKPDKNEDVHKSVMAYDADYPRVINRGTNGAYVKSYKEFDGEGNVNIIFDFED